MKTFILISEKPYEVSPYIKDWAQKVVKSLEWQNVPEEGIKKIITGTIATKSQLHNYCVNHNLCFNTISKIVFE